MPASRAFSGRSGARRRPRAPRGARPGGTRTRAGRAAPPARRATPRARAPAPPRASPRGPSRAASPRRPGGRPSRRGASGRPREVRPARPPGPAGCAGPVSDASLNMNARRAPTRQFPRPKLRRRVVVPPKPKRSHTGQSTATHPACQQRLRRGDTRDGRRRRTASRRSITQACCQASGASSRPSRVAKRAKRRSASSSTATCVSP